MKLFRNEKGYSLLITLMLILLFTILGASLIAMTLNGLSRNETREDIVQSKDLATKGIDRLATQITYELDQIIPNNVGISARNFAIEFDSIVDKYSCEKNTPLKQFSIEKNTEDYSVCIFNPTFVSAGTEESLRRELTFESTGTSGDSSEKFYAKYSVGATNYPEVLNYALGSFIINNEVRSKYKNSKGLLRFPNWSSGDGNLVLNGGISIEGDVKVDGDLITSDYGIWKNGSYYRSVGSVQPQISGISRPYGKIYIGGKMFKAKNMKDFLNVTSDNYNKYTNSLNSAFYDETQSIESMFLSNSQKKSSILLNDQESVVSPVKIEKPLAVTPIDYETKSKTLKLEPTKLIKDGGNRQVLSSNREINKLNRPGLETYFSVSSGTKRVCTKTDIWEWYIFLIWGGYKEICETITVYDETPNSTFTFKDGPHITGKLGIPGNVNLSAASTLETNSSYIDGSLGIGDTQGQCEKDTKKSLTVKGVYYIKGNLTICNRLLTSDAIFYVEGNITIRESQILGLEIINNNDKRVSSLMLFAQGNIELANNSVDNPTASIFKGYLYSEKELEIYGVGSNINIIGGVSARKIILNAVRGSAKNNNYDSILVQQGLGKEKSRLQIIYDMDVIKNFSELDIQTEPWINNTSPPLELERSYTPPS